MDDVVLCPYLGSPGDRKTCHRYPNALNVCYASATGRIEFEPVALPQQSQLCLTADHVLCPSYLGAMVARARAGRPAPAQTYLQFFGLQEEPFSIVPQSRFLRESDSQQQAHTGLRWLIDQQHGLGLLFGQVGTGKTLLCHTLHQELTSDHSYLSTLLLTPSYHSEYALMTDLLAQWRIKPARLRSRRNLEEVAHDYLLQVVLGRKKTAVLIVDEAQILPSRALHQVCRLLNWQDEGRQLLQVILAGQPTLQRGLHRVPALRDRAVVEFTLTGMTPSETGEVIAERLQRAGRHKELFAAGAVDLIHQHTGGMPRQVMIVCLKCLWRAYLGGQRLITTEIVDAVIKDNNGGDLFAVQDRRAVQITGGQFSPARQPLLSRLGGLFRRS